MFVNMIFDVLVEKPVSTMRSTQYYIEKSVHTQNNTLYGFVIVCK